MPFVTSLRVELIDHLTNDGQGTWLLMSPLKYVATNGIEYVIPEGFATDFASVPRIPLAYLLAGCTAHAPAVLHDWLIRSNYCKREEADLLFREAMESIDMPNWRINIMYNAVRGETQNIANRNLTWE